MENFLIICLCYYLLLNQGTNEDDSQSDPHPEAGIFRGQTTQNLGTKDCRDMVTGVTGEIRHCRDMVTGVTGKIRHCRDMVTGVTGEIRHCRDMVTGVQGEISYRPDVVTRGSEEMRNGLDIVTAVQEEIPYCSSGISSANQKKARSTSQRQIRSENTLRHLKQTRFCWPFSNWRRTVILPISKTLETESRNCLSPSRQQCPPSTGNQRNLNCLKIYSKRVWKSTIS